MSVLSTWQVTGMTCAHCVSSVREELGEIPGVESVAVTLETGTVTVSSRVAIDRDAVAAAVSEAGYGLT